MQHCSGARVPGARVKPPNNLHFLQHVERPNCFAVPSTARGASACSSPPPPRLLLCMHCRLPKSTLAAVVLANCFAGGIACEGARGSCAATPPCCTRKFIPKLLHTNYTVVWCIGACVSYSTEDEEVEDDIYIYISMHLYAGVWMSIGPLETLYIYMYKRCSAPPSTLVADGQNFGWRVRRQIYNTFTTCDSSCKLFGPGCPMTEQR